MGVSLSKKPSIEEIKHLVSLYLEANEIKGDVNVKWSYDFKVLNIILDLPTGVYNDYEIESEIVILIDKTNQYLPINVEIISNDSF